MVWCGVMWCDVCVCVVVTSDVYMNIRTYVRTYECRVMHVYACMEMVGMVTLFIS